jgi:hypothetical protein
MSHEVMRSAVVGRGSGCARRTVTSLQSGGQPAGYTTPVSSSETAHNRRCSATSWDLALDATRPCTRHRRVLRMTLALATGEC